MAEVFKLDATEIDSLRKITEDYGSESLKVINDVLHEEAAQVIKDKIQNLIPESGRTWKRKKASARNAQPFTQENSMLAVTIKTVKSYNYLYFPDDGANTKKHIGNKQFMKRGAEEAAVDVINLCLGRLVEKG